MTESKRSNASHKIVDSHEFATDDGKFVYTIVEKTNWFSCTSPITGVTYAVGNEFGSGVSCTQLQDEKGDYYLPKDNYVLDAEIIEQMKYTYIGSPEFTSTPIYKQKVRVENLVTMFLALVKDPELDDDIHTQWFGYTKTDKINEYDMDPYSYIEHISIGMQTAEIATIGLCSNLPYHRILQKLKMETDKGMELVEKRRNERMDWLMNNPVS